ncbi:MAG: cellulase family glycosylhydrolase [Planctomycetota bacterium]
MHHLYGEATRLGWLAKLGGFLALALGWGCVSAQPVEGNTSDSLAELRVDGRHLVGPDGQPVVLKGVNLGNWFLLEAWMLDLDTAKVPDHHTIVTTFAERFGIEKANRLMDVHYAHWFTVEDFARLRTFNFNAVRLPFHYTLIERNGGEADYDFRWLDHAIDLARDAGLYVILDLHGAPGGQSVDQPSGRVGQNDLWTSDDAQRRMTQLWVALAERYGDEPVVAAYDVLNEPYGDMQQDLRQPMIDLMNRVIPAIRAVDPDTLIYVPGTLQGITFYGDPNDHGWTNTGFTEHYYRGLFGDITALSSHLDMLGPGFAEKQRFFEQTDAPMLAGEFNVVFDHVGGADLMRAYYDRFEQLGWAATMWCAKRVLKSPDPQGDGWALTINETPMEPLDIFADSAKTLENKLKSYGTGGVIVNERVRAALSAETPAVAFPLDDQPQEAQAQPAQEAVAAPWQARDIGDATPGGQRINQHHWTITGGGADIFGTTDAFRFVSRELPEGDRWTAWTVLEAFDAPGRYGKAGWMLRGSDAHDAPHVLFHAFTNGTLMLAQRDEHGGDTEEVKVGMVRFPVGLAVQRDGDTVRFATTDAQGHWVVLVERKPAWLDKTSHVGLATLANDRTRTATAYYLAPSLKDEALPSLVGLPLTPSAATSIAVPDASFELGEGWHGWGRHLTTVEDADALSGQRVMRYACRNPGENSGTWTNVTSGVAFGDALTAFAWVRVDRATDEDASIELRLESPPLYEGGPWITLATASYGPAELAQLPGTDAWRPVRVAGTALTDTVRVLIQISGDADLSLDAVEVSVSP